MSDLDFETGQSLGVAVLEGPHFPSDTPADPRLSRAVTDALIHAMDVIPDSRPGTDRLPWMPGSDTTPDVVVHVGPSALVLRAPSFALPQGVAPEEVFFSLTVRESFRSRLREGLVKAMALHRLKPSAVFVTSGEIGLVAGAILEA